MNASKRESCVKICAQELLPHSIAAGFIKEQFMMLNLQRWQFWWDQTLFR